MKKNLVIIKDLGLVDYKNTWDLQMNLNKELVQRKRSFINDGGKDEDYEPRHYLLFCQHPPVFTLGKSGKIENLLLSPSNLEKEGIQYYKINRGGDITYHGPGQLVVYPIFDLEWFFRDVHRYVRTLEEIVIKTLAEYGLEAHREDGFTGVWTQAGLNDTPRKLCAIGVHLSRWVSLHGFALNVNPKLDHFDHIIPCGISPLEKQVTSMEKELGKKIEMKDLKAKLIDHFSKLFNFAFKFE